MVANLSTGMLSKIYKVTPEKFKKNMNILVYGNQGVGKTFLAGTAQDHPDMKDVLVLSIEGGLMTLGSRGDIAAIDISSMGELEEIMLALKNKEPGWDKYKTLVVDSITELQTLNLEQIVINSLSSKPNKTRDDIYQEDYGKSTTQLKRVLRTLRDLPINVIYTALPKQIRANGSERVTSVEPSLTSKLGQSLMGYMDFVWYMYKQDIVNDEGVVVGEKRFLLTRESGVYKAKTRGVKFSNTLGMVYENPNMSDLYNLYLESESKEEK